MSTLRSTLTPVANRILCALSILLFHASCVWAQAEDSKDAPKPKNWVLSYILVILLIGLGLSLICRSSNRRADVRQDLPDA